MKWGRGNLSKQELETNPLLMRENERRILNGFLKQLSGLDDMAVFRVVAWFMLDPRIKGVMERIAPPKAEQNKGQ